MRIVLILVLLGVVAFCAFGFTATFEPLPRDQQLVWRAVYGACGLAALAGAVWAVVHGRRKRGREG